MHRVDQCTGPEREFRGIVLRSLPRSVLTGAGRHRLGRPHGAAVGCGGDSTTPASTPVMNIGQGRAHPPISSDSLLEGDGFELPVPRAMQARLNAKIAGSSCAVRNSRGRNCSFGGRRGVGIGSPITRNRGLSTVRKIVVGADVVIRLSSLIFLVSQFNTVRILRGNRTV